MKIIAFILFALQLLSIVGGIMEGTFVALIGGLFFLNGSYGFFRALGYFLPTIIGCILLFCHSRKNKK